MNTPFLFTSVALLTLGFWTAQAQNTQNAPQSMRFFVTSVGSGKGGDLGDSLALMPNASRSPPPLGQARAHGTPI